MEARCECGALRAELPGPTPAIVACHCLACQRRTGAPFGVLAYYPADRVSLSGEPRRYDRTADSGNTFSNFFCPDCGGTLYVQASKHPEMIGIAVGMIADPAYPPPARSVWEQSRHEWVAVPEAALHFPQGNTG